MKKINFSTFFKNFFYVTTGNIVGQLMNFIVMIYVARAFKPTDFGVINFTNIIVTYFFSLSCLGLQGLGILEVNKAKNSLKKTVDNIVSLRIVLSILVFVLLSIVTVFINRDTTFKVMVILNGLTIIGSSYYIDWFFNGLQEMKYVSIAVIIKNVLYSALVAVILFFGINQSMYIIPISLTLATFASSTYLFSKYLKQYKLKYKFSFDKKEYKSLLSKSWPFYFNGVFALINLNMDTLMLGIMKSDYEVGLYSAVYRIANALILCVTIIFTPIFPMLIKNFNEGKHEALSLIVNKLRKVMIAISIPLAFGGVILKNEAMSTIYGKAYAEANNTFVILILYVSLLCVREIYGYELNSWGLQKKYMKSVMVSSIYNIISNLIIIPHFGIEGAAFNTLVSEIINYTMMRHTIRSNIKIKYENKYIVNILISTLAMVSVIMLLKLATLNAIYLAAVGAAVYGVCIFISKVFTVSEIKDMLIKS